MTLEQLDKDIADLTAQRDRQIGLTNQTIGALLYAQALRAALVQSLETVAKTEPTT